MCIKYFHTYRCTCSIAAGVEPCNLQHCPQNYTTVKYFGQDCTDCCESMNLHKPLMDKLDKLYDITEKGKTYSSNELGDALEDWKNTDAKYLEIQAKIHEHHKHLRISKQQDADKAKNAYIMSADGLENMFRNLYRFSKHKEQKAAGLTSDRLTKAEMASMRQYGVGELAKVDGEVALMEAYAASGKLSRADEDHLKRHLDEMKMDSDIEAIVHSQQPKAAGAAATQQNLGNKQTRSGHDAKERPMVRTASVTFGKVEVDIIMQALDEHQRKVDQALDLLDEADATSLDLTNAEFDKEMRGLRKLDEDISHVTAALRKAYQVPEMLKEAGFDALMQSLGQRQQNTGNSTRQQLPADAAKQRLNVVKRNLTQRGPDADWELCEAESDEV